MCKQLLYNNGHDQWCKNCPHCGCKLHPWTGCGNCGLNPLIGKQVKFAGQVLFVSYNGQFLNKKQEVVQAPVA